MSARAALWPALAAGLLLAACAATPTAQVVRFHTNQPMARGTIYLAPADPKLAGTLEFGAQANVVGAELSRAGFTVVSDPGQAQFTAVIDIGTAERNGPPRQPNVSVGLGGGFSTGNVGIGTNVNVPVGGQPRPQTIGRTTLAVAIKDNRSGAAVWEGRATAEATSGPTGTAAAAPLAAVLFKDFPGPSGISMQVPL